VTSSFAVFEAVILVKSDNIWFENQKKKNVEIKEVFFCINLHIKDRLNIEFTAC